MRVSKEVVAPSEEREGASTMMLHTQSCADHAREPRLRGEGRLVAAKTQPLGKVTLHFETAKDAEWRMGFCDAPRGYSSC